MISRCLFSFILLLCCFTSFVKGQVSEATGGIITYRYIGDSTSIPYHYIIQLQINRVPDTAHTQVAEIEISSSCFTDTSLSLSAVGFSAIGLSNYVYNQVNCGDTVLSHGQQVFSFFYRGTVILPGKCADYKMVYTGGSRDSTITNLINPASTKFYIRSFLNNSLGPNTSAKFIRSPRSIFCKNIATFNSYHVVEPNQDSISIHLISALDSLGVPVNYTSGLSFIDPIPSIGSFSLSKLHPSLAGLYVLSLEVREYRFDGVIGLYRQIASVSLELNIRVKSNCSKSLYSTAFGGPGVLKPINRIYCGDSIISFRTDLFQGSSLSMGATEFRLIDRNSVPRPIIDGQTYIRPDLLADSIWLKLHAPLLANDTLLLYLKNGSDNNTLISPCGNEFPIFDTALVIVNDCGVTGIIENQRSPMLSNFPNPTHNSFTLQSGEHLPETITLFDMQGKELKSIKPNSTSSEIDISEFSSGVYLLKVEVGGQKVVRLIQKM